MVQAGGLVTEILYTGDLKAWIKSESLKVTVVKPKDGKTLKELVSREWTYVVDLKTMKIVWKGFGSYDGSKPSSVDAGLAKMTQLLSK